jgi:hypothetical protein
MRGYSTLWTVIVDCIVLHYMHIWHLRIRASSLQFRASKINMALARMDKLVKRLMSNPARAAHNTLIMLISVFWTNSANVQGFNWMMIIIKEKFFIIIIILLNILSIFQCIHPSSWGVLFILCFDFFPHFYLYIQ